MTPMIYYSVQGPGRLSLEGDSALNYLARMERLGGRSTCQGTGRHCSSLHSPVMPSCRSTRTS